MASKKPIPDNYLLRGRLQRMGREGKKKKLSSDRNWPTGTN